MCLDRYFTECIHLMSFSIVNFKSQGILNMSFTSLNGFHSTFFEQSYIKDSFISHIKKDRLYDILNFSIHACIFLNANMMHM